MSGRGLVRDALAGRAVERVPFLPLVGTFAANQLQMSARDFYSNPGALAQGLELSRRVSRADGVVCVPEVTWLAEACGCSVSWEESPRLTSGGVGQTDPVCAVQRGRVPAVLDALGRLKHALGQQWALVAAMPGPYLLSSQRFGAHLAGALAGGDPEGTACLNSSAAVCLEVLRRIAAFEPDAVILIDGAESPPATVEAIASVYETLTNVTAYYGCAAVYHGTTLDWVDGPAVPRFDAFWPAETAAGGTGVPGAIPVVATLPRRMLSESPASAVEGLRSRYGEKAVLIGTDGEILADTPIAALKAARAALYEA